MPSHPIARRTLLVLAGAGLATPFAGGGSALAAGDLAAEAVSFVKARGQEVIAIVNAPGNLEAKREAVSRVLRESVDIGGVARFVLGRHWRTATEAQRKEYLSLFEDTLVHNLAARFGELTGVDFNVGRSVMASDDEAVVTTTITRPNSPAITLDWRVAKVDGAPKVVDVVAEGTSLRITQRSEYSAVVQRSGGIDGLLRAMRQQLAQLEQGNPQR